MIAEARPRVLACVPDLRKGGGVANYYRAIADSFTLPVEYFHRGSRKEEGAFWGRATRMLRDYREFARLLGSGRFDLVHLNTSLGIGGVIRDAVFLWLAKRQGMPVVLFVRGWSPAFEARTNRFVQALLRATLGRADGIVVLSDDYREKLRRWGFRPRIWVETTVADSTLTENVRIDELIAERESAGGLTVLFMARLEAQKGIYEALSGFRELKKKHPDTRLVVAGAGREQERVARICAEPELGEDVYIGYVSGADKRQVLHHADIYLLPTVREGMPNSVVEAMACGLALVASPVGGIGDVFEDTEAGLPLRSATPADVAEQLGRLVTDRDTLRRVQRSNFMYAAKRFHTESVTRRLEGIYRETWNSAGGRETNGVP